MIDHVTLTILYHMACVGFVWYFTRDSNKETDNRTHEEPKDEQ